MAAGRIRAWWAWRVWAVAACAVAGWVLPGQAQAAFADVTVHFIGELVQSRSDGFGGGAPNAQVVFSGGGDLVPWREGHGDFLVAASASNARGALHAAVDVATVGRGRADGVASASVVDSLTFGGTQAVDLELRLAVQGSFTASGRNAFFRTNSGLSVGSFSSQVTSSWVAGSTVANQSPTVSVSPGTGDVQVISREPGNVILWHTVRQTVLPGTVLDVVAFLTVSGDVSDDSRAQVNFGHTAQLWLGLPAGTPFTSRSGVFLTEAPSLPVPEPAQPVLLLAGLVALFTFCRRCRPPRGRRVAAAGALAAGLMLGLTGGAQAITTASASSNTFQSGRFEQLHMTALPRAAVALSGAGMLNTGPGEGSFLATGEADLRRGTLRASAETSTTGRGVTLATADATFGDFLFFDNTSTITVTLQLAVHGAFDGLGPAAGEVNAGLRLGGERLEARLRWNTDLGGLPTQGVRLLPVEGGTSATRQVALRSTLPANTLALLSLTGDIEPGWMLSVDSWMAVSARAGTNAIASASFGNTAQLSLLVPEGVTVRSVSGHFLAEPLAPVPEPATGAMLAAGLVLLQLLQRTRRRFIAPSIGAAMLPALLLAGAAPASAQMAHAGVWNSSNFNNPFPAGNARSETVTSGRANVGHSATTSPFSDRVAWVAGASADLRRGSVGVEIQADRSGNPAATQGDTVWALGELNETLTFSGTRPGLVDFAAGISGSFQSIDGSAFQADGFLFAGGLSGQLDFHWVNNLSSPSVSVFASPGTTGIRNEPGGLFGTMHLLRLVQPGETLALQLRLQLRVGPGAYDHAVANFGHTAQLGITLPEGMSFTSASGDFMVDAPPLPVPEPAAAWLLLAGLGLLWTGGRRPGPGRREKVLPALFAACLASLPALSQAQASASVTLSGIATPFQLDADISQPERATALLSGGGVLVGLSDDIAGHGDFLVGATADLARGTLRGVAQLNIVGQGIADAHTNAGLFDTLVFDGSEPVPLHLRLAVHGAFFDSGSNLQEVVARLRVGSQTENATLTWFGWPYPVQHNRPVRVTGGDGVQAISTEAANTIVWLTVDQLVLPGVPVDVVAQLLLNVVAGANSQVNVNFGNTAQLWLEVPEGVSYSSASGRFLTASAVPEPGVAALWLAGLVLLGRPLLRGAMPGRRHG